MSASSIQQRKTRTWPLRVVVAVATILSGCARTDVPMEGLVQGFGSDQSKVFVLHEEVDGFMPEMTMPFAADSVELAGLNIGDAISFTLHVGRSRTWIDGIERIPRSRLSLTTDKTPAPYAAQTVLTPGDAFPAVRLTDQRGRELSLPPSGFDATLVDFIYTRCPLPDYCPLLSTRFRAIQHATNASVLLVSITIDPAYDTPAVLSEYAERYDAEYDRWRFATGDEKTLADLYSRSGVIVFDGEATLDHNLATILIDGSGSVAKIWRDTDATVASMIDEIDLLRTD